MSLELVLSRTKDFLSFVEGMAPDVFREVLKVNVELIMDDCDADHFTGISIETKKGLTREKQVFVSLIADRVTEAINGHVRGKFENNFLYTIWYLHVFSRVTDPAHERVLTELIEQTVAEGASPAGSIEYDLI